MANYIWLSGGAKYKHFSRFYVFFSRAFLKLADKLWIAVLLLLDSMLPPEAAIELTVDDTTRKKSGRKIQGASNYQNRAGSARQEYRTLWGINFVYVIASLYWDKGGKIFKLALPVGLRVYLKEKVAIELERPFHPRSALARHIIDFIAGILPHLRFILKADGGYSTRKFLRGLPANVEVDGRFPVNSRLPGLRPRPKKDNRGRPAGKGKGLGTPQEWMQQDEGWVPHPEEEGAWVKTVVRIWHSIMPGVPIKVVAVWRKGSLPADKRSGKKELEAFFSTDTSLTEAQVLQHYSIYRPQLSLAQFSQPAVGRQPSTGAGVYISNNG
ncbi:MAG: transposase [Phaeodactylibacter sp.]|nr:transposase [Phaeodactylibacter sp.]